MLGGLYYGLYALGRAVKPEPPIIVCLTACVSARQLVTAGAINCTDSVIEACLGAHPLVTATTITTCCSKVSDENYAETR